MATSAGKGVATAASDLRTEFKTKEGIYKNVKSLQYCRPKRQPLIGEDLSPTRISLVTTQDAQGHTDLIVFNSGRELYCFPFEGAEIVPDLQRWTDKHIYRTSYPLAHDVNQVTRSTEHLDLIVGFNRGPIQHLNPVSRSNVGIYNGDHTIDNTDITCVRWVPGYENLFISTHVSGYLYVWTTEDSHKSPTPPTYSLSKTLTDTVIHSCKPKGKSQLVSRWKIGHGSINMFEFSPDTRHMAVVSQDGFLRVYDFQKEELHGRMRSYFGGLLCVCWSPDGRFVVTGGEDDLVSVWSFHIKKIVVRGEGHCSYVNAVAFDPYNSQSGASSSISDASRTVPPMLDNTSHRGSRFFGEDDISYRLGSVGQDGLLCLWELTGDSLKPRRQFGRTRSRSSKHAYFNPDKPEGTSVSQGVDFASRSLDTNPGLSNTLPRGGPSQSSSSPFAERRASTGSRPEKRKRRSHLSQQEEHRHPPSPPRDSDKQAIEMNNLADEAQTSSLPPNSSSTALPDSTQSLPSSVSSTKSKKKQKKDKALKEGGKEKSSGIKSITKKIKNIPIFSNYQAPLSRRSVAQFETCQNDDIAFPMNEVNLIEALVCKKISHERLSDIAFREDCLLTSCMDGYISVWVRPNHGMTIEVMSEPPCPSRSVNPPGLNSPRPGGVGART